MRLKSMSVVVGPSSQLSNERHLRQWWWRRPRRRRGVCNSSRSVALAAASSSGGGDGTLRFEAVAVAAAVAVDELVVLAIIVDCRSRLVTMHTLLVSLCIVMAMLVDARAPSYTTASIEESDELQSTGSWHDHTAMLAARTDAPSRCVAIPPTFRLCHGSQVGNTRHVNAAAALLSGFQV